jgi:hypothetical protein
MVALSEEKVDGNVSCEASRALRKKSGCFRVVF